MVSLSGGKRGEVEGGEQHYTYMYRARRARGCHCTLRAAVGRVRRIFGVNAAYI